MKIDDEKDQAEVTNNFSKFAEREFKAGYQSGFFKGLAAGIIISICAAIFLKYGF